ncbi:MAG TPA: hypothetical protein VGN16_09455 [Acidobacteriaceae bacterium]|jgi:hypothetical protein
MKLVGAGDQHKRDFTYWADGSIASITLPQLVLPEHTSRSSLFFQNTSSAIMWIGMGSARATCSLTSGVVTSVTITNGGFNFTKPPIVHFLGGAVAPAFGQHPANTSYVGAAGPGFPSPQSPARGRAVLTGSAVTSVAIDNGGSSYVATPYVFMQNSDLDPNGCFDPSATQSGVAGSGFQLYPGQSMTWNGTVMTTDALAVFCATLNSTFSCGWTT